jgi:hypothetical protein
MQEGAMQDENETDNITLLNIGNDYIEEAMRTKDLKEEN